jgi:hypothetical protein
VYAFRDAGVYGKTSQPLPRHGSAGIGPAGGHSSEGWVPMPTAKPEVLRSQTVDECLDRTTAVNFFDRLTLQRNDR